MKSIFTVIVVFIVSITAPAQKLITTINTINRVDPYSFKYNKSDGAFVYSDYDTTIKKNTLFTSKGKSMEYDYTMVYSALFDNEGNVYTYGYNNITDTIYKYFLIRNNEEVASFDFISDGWDINSGIIYLAAKENNKSIMVSYDTRTSIISRGKAYDEIFLVNFPEVYYEGEPSGTIGFTNDGLPFFLASDGNSKFMVIGSNEQKHYADIDLYMVKKDNAGQLAYIARSKGTFYSERGNTFVVHGSKEFKPYDYIYGPFIFDKSGNPVYVASDSIGENLYRSRVMSANKEGESYEGSIYDFKLSPSGKLFFVVSTQEPSSKKGEYVYENFLVSGKNESRKYNSVSDVRFVNGDIPVFTASNKSSKYFIVKGDKAISEKYESIYGYSILDDGSLAYIGSNYGNYDKNIPDRNFVHVYGKKYGPYEYVSMIDYTTGNYILTHNNKFAFVSGKLTNKTEYTYKYKVTTGDWESSEFDAIDVVKLINGKSVFVAGNMFDKINYLYNYNLYIDNKLKADGYSAFLDLAYDKVSGKTSCIGCKGSSFYLFELDI